MTKAEKEAAELISYAIHQLRNPLGGISMSTELLLRGIAGDVSEDTKKYLIEISNFTAQLTESLNVFSYLAMLELKTINLEKEDININQVINELLEVLSSLMTRKNIELSSLISIENIYFNKNILKFILRSFLHNAITYSQNQSKIKILTQENNNEIIIEVADEGMGILKEDQLQIMTKIFRSEEAKRINPAGNGLSLYVANMAAEATSSRIEFISSAKGSSFKLIIKK